MSEIRYIGEENKADANKHGHSYKDVYTIDWELFIVNK